MSDRELLELAAKAAAVDPALIDQHGQIDGYDVNGEPVVLAGWNPLADDGDALRLAVKLGILATYSGERFELFQSEYRRCLDQDLKPSEATRRAILLTAAEIGRRMKDSAPRAEGDRS